ncbi:unnamed protein product [Mytilus edulis]|uniref:Reverse transcriptase domain-containing protein n=1 Tax=Mytilus edulis TaxID=6550 RepID=A0A8S3UN56_MYTED|nr:unnamed protein product [Mytilus edulis]
MVIMVVFHSNSPFLSRGPPPPSHLVGTELGTSVTTVVCMDIGQKTVKKGEIQQLPEEHQTERSPDILKVQNVDNFDSFYDYESGTSCINVKNRLKNSLDFWKNINASKFILDLIENGYKIPLINEPESVLLRNNKSALEHKDFVEKAVQELIDASLIKEVSNRPHVVNPLTVSINSSGKGRLILDLRHVNKQVVYSKIKFEDWKTASQFLTSDCFGFAFDLKAGYHHINIFPNHQKYLGFSWKFGETVKYFVFTVLPFGLCSAGYVFTKVVRPLIAHWRKDGIKITVYLDDGLCLAETEKLCCEQSVRVKNDLILSGFVPNKDKCIWTPVQTLVWLGFTWNLKSSLMELPLIKIENFINLIDVILSKAFKVKIRLLAKLCGKIISFSPAIGNVTQIMTRCTFSVINLRQDWDQYVDLRQHSDSIQEIMFWKQNIHCLKPVPLLRNNSEFNVFTDASDIGAGGYLQGTDYIAHRQWSTIFSVGFWSQNEQIKHPELKALFNSLSSTILDARAKSTVEKYAGYFKRFVKWTEKYSEIKCVLPCQELYVGLYLQNLIQSANHYSVIESAFYGIKWAHNLAGVANPCDSEMVRLIVEASRRKLNRPIEKKSPVTSDIMIKLFSKYISECAQICMLYKNLERFST